MGQTPQDKNTSTCTQGQKNLGYGESNPGLMSLLSLEEEK